MRISKTLFYSQSLLGTFDEATLIEQKEKKERRKNTTSKNVCIRDVESQEHIKTI